MRSQLQNGVDYDHYTCIACLFDLFVLVFGIVIDRNHQQKGQNDETYRTIQTYYEVGIVRPDITQNSHSIYQLFEYRN